jgi:hypothetical protein
MALVGDVCLDPSDFACHCPEAVFSTTLRLQALARGYN